MINRAGAHFLGRSIGSTLGRTGDEVLSSKTARPSMASDQEVMRDGKSRLDEEVVTSDGQTRVLRVTKYPWRAGRARHAPCPLAAFGAPLFRRQ